MMERLMECVANVSEGRDGAKVERITASVSEESGCWLLDTQSDEDHNRTVVTFAGAPGALVRAAVSLAGRCAKLIDLNEHRGVHPRIGALDVLPFVPLSGMGMAECVACAELAGREIWEHHGIPAYLYGEAARRVSRRSLADVRRGQFEKLRDLAGADPTRLPDIGGPGLHPKAGAVAVGARKAMIAYNIQLETADVEIAGGIAKQVRESSGGLSNVMAMGVFLRSRGLAQVSMNLTDFETTPPHVVFEAVRHEAEALGVSVKGSEIIGLIPRRALDLAGERDLMWENLTPSSVLENRLADLIGQARRTVE
jgi:glutamate formiminotransferase